MLRLFSYYLQWEPLGDGEHFFQKINYAAFSATGIDLLSDSFCRLIATLLQMLQWEQLCRSL